MVQVRIGAIADLPAVREVATLVYTDTFGPYFTPEDLENYLEATFGLEMLLAEFKDSGSHLYIALDKFRIAGFLRLRRNKDVDAWLGDNHIELHQLFVRREYQGNGVAGRLMERAFPDCREYEWMWVAVWEGNLRARRFYEKWKFEWFREHFYEIDGEKQVDWWMRKKINILLT